MNFTLNKSEVDNIGYTIFDNIYSDDEVNQLIDIISGKDGNSDTFRKSANLFAIRQFLKEVPEVTPVFFNSKLNEVINHIFGTGYFVVKSIYFDKPEQSNWFVAYHQDLTISVDKKSETEGYGPWTVKQNQYAVQPPVNVLENIFTVRIHLDNTNKDNGALRVVPKSHIKKIYRPELINWDNETEDVCNVNKGGVMIMKPLLLHSSARSTNNNRRRVIHIEFSNIELNGQIQWAERMDIL